MEIHRCMKCMRPYAPGETVCPVCGNVHGQEDQPDFALRPGTILQGIYLVGKVLGQGGFGITYVGFDMVLETKVAIKEFYPMSTGTVTRDGLHYTSVSWGRGGSSESIRQKGTESFLKEARKMARLDSIPGVVGVKSLFVQNETAYIVMSFVDGVTLKDQLHRTGPLSFDACVDTLAPVMEAMGRVHKQGIIHRDISPDNIMIRPDGSLWILDLGAAKDIDLSAGDERAMQSSQLITKHGFSPAEQYMESGEIGTWTDVYAMSAMVYYCITGKLPPAATDRMFADRLVCRPPLTEAQFGVIARGMAISPNQRIRTMEELLAQLRSVKSGSGSAEASRKAAEKKAAAEAARKAVEEMAAAEAARKAAEQKAAAEAARKAVEEMAAAEAARKAAEEKAAAEAARKAAEEKATAEAARKAAEEKAAAEAARKAAEKKAAAEAARKAAEAKAAQQNREPVRTPPQKKKSKAPLIAGIAAAAVLCAVIGVVALRPKQPAGQNQNPAQTQSQEAGATGSFWGAQSEQAAAAPSGINLDTFLKIPVDTQSLLENPDYDYIDLVYGSYLVDELDGSGRLLRQHIFMHDQYAGCTEFDSVSGFPVSYRRIFPDLQGHISGAWEITFDAYGNRVDTVYYGKSGEVTEYWRNTPHADSRAHVGRTEHLDASGTLLDAREYTYDDQGRTDTITVLDGSNARKEVYRYTYGAMGAAEEIRHTDSVGNLLDTSNFDYDDAGRMTTQWIYDKAGQLVKQIDWGYDAYSHVTWIMNSEYDASGAVIRYDYRLNVDEPEWCMANVYEDGTLKRVEISSGLGEKVYTAFYGYSDDHMLEWQRLYDNAGNAIRQWKYEFDPNTGNLRKVEVYEGAELLETWIYDEQGNFVGFGS